PVDGRALARSLNLLVARHAALRTTFYPASSIPRADRSSRLSLFGKTGLFAPGLFRQMVAATGTLTLERRTLVAHSARGRAAVLQAIVDEEMERCFAYHCAPLLRASLVTVGACEHLLVLVAHHLVCDLVSMEILRNELEALYAREGDGGMSPVPESGMPFH